MTISILIFGSCVSRDIFNFQINDFEVAGYFARSSFASAFDSLPVNDIYTKNLESEFQKKVVSADLDKNLKQCLRSTEYDLLLIDFIDERFNIFIFDQGGVCTVSSELISAGLDVRKEVGRLVQSGSDEFFERWENGWVRFLSIVDALQCRQKIRINKVLWATTTSAGREFETYSCDYILTSNHFLERLYNRVAKDLEPWQFIDAKPIHLLAAEAHRWGVSPFHYIDAYYIHALRKIKTSFDIEVTQPGLLAVDGVNDEYPFDRSLIKWQRFSPTGDGGDLKISSCRTSGNGVIEYNEGVPTLRFGVDGGTHQVAFRLPKPMLANGLAARLRLQSWSAIRYLAFGYTYQGVFRHIKVVNPAQGQWLTVSLVHGDIAYGLQNEWNHPPASEITDIRVYLRADAAQGVGTLEVAQFICWEEAERPATEPTTATLPLILPAQKPVSPDLLSVLYGYLLKCFRQVQEQAAEFLKSGRCPLYGETQLDWQLERALPDNLATVGTYAFSWHSLHPASILMVFSKNSGTDAPVFAAREMVTNWLDRSYYTPDPDKKFAWYDHGTAERQMAFILMWAEGIERGFDQRFMMRLGGAMVRHAELLETEQFYASHQPTRYHNHAWFQDLALMATALAMPDWPASQRWMQRAIERLSDQLETLIIRDNGFSVFVENSIGYHQGVQRIVELAGDIVRLTGVESPIPDVAVELSRFSDFFRYPDNRAPAQGDTFRRSNPQGDAVQKLKPYPEPEVVILPKAGYGIVKGNHDGARFMFSMFATSLCRTHKHEDDLSFTLFFDGIEWLIDPSFYSHEYKSSIPAYLRSAAAHNSVFIADRPYTIDPGHSTLNGTTSGDMFELRGQHRCYADVIVRRAVWGLRTSLAFEFSDEVQTASGDATEPRLMLHCGEGVEVVCSGRLLTLTHSDSKYCLTALLPSDQIKISKGMIDGDRVRGVSGTAFLKMSEICTVEVIVPSNVPLEWLLAAQERRASR